MQKIYPCLWFDNQAEEAANFYVSIFKENSKILDIARYTDIGPGKPGSVVTVTFELNGQRFMGLNGGPVFKMNEAISFVIDCKDQADVDYYWDSLVKGGAESQCGWLKDRYGLSWQVVPAMMEELMSKGNEKKNDAMMKAMLGMAKLDIAALQRTYDEA
ncbi:MAG TPA: VOC family protein [Candidatus Paceibacterota bacterium]|nr:VOC family protein [Candidatus Paceibacterota bacterium]